MVRRRRLDRLLVALLTAIPVGVSEAPSASGAEATQIRLDHAQPIDLVVGDIARRPM